MTAWRVVPLPAVVLVALLAGPGAAHATCWPSCQLATVGTDCAPRTSWRAGERVTFTLGCGHCCAAGGPPISCSYRATPAPVSVTLQRLGPNLHPDGEVASTTRATGRTCGGLGVAEVVTPVPEGHWSLTGASGQGLHAQFFVSRAAAQLSASVPITATDDVLGVGAAPAGGELALAWLTRPAGARPHGAPVAATFHFARIGADGQVRRGAPTPVGNVSWLSWGRVVLARTPTGWLAGTGDLLLTLDAEGRLQGAPRRQPGQVVRLLERPGRGPVAVWVQTSNGGDHSTATAAFLAPDGRPQHAPVAVPGGWPDAAAITADGALFAHSTVTGTAISHLGSTGRVASRAWLEGRGASALWWRGHEARLVLGRDLHRLDRDGQPLGTPQRLSRVVDGATVEVVGDDLVLLFPEGPSLVLERRSATERQGRALVARDRSWGSIRQLVLAPAAAPTHAWVVYSSRAPSAPPAPVDRLRRGPPRAAPLPPEDLRVARVALPALDASTALPAGDAAARPAPPAAAASPLCWANGGAPAPAVACATQAARGVRALAVAGNARELALAWITDPDQLGHGTVMVGRRDAALAAVGAPRTVRPTGGRAVALAATGRGYLLAVETHVGVELYALGPELAPRGAPRVLRGASTPRFLERGAGPLLATARGLTILEVRALHPDGRDAGGFGRLPVDQADQPPAALLAATPGGALVAWQEPTRVMVAALTPGGQVRALRPALAPGVLAALRALVPDGKRLLLYHAVGASPTGEQLPLAVQPLDANGKPAGPVVAAPNALAPLAYPGTFPALRAGAQLLLVAGGAVLVLEGNPPKELKAEVPAGGDLSALTRRGPDAVVAWTHQQHPGQIGLVRIPLPAAAQPGR